MNWKRLVFPLIIVLGWSVPLAWLGSTFEATLQWSIAGLLIGSFFALLGELIGNWLARSLSVTVILGTLLGAGAVAFIFGPGLVEFGTNIEHPTSDYGAGMPNILALLELLVYSGAVAFGIVAGALVGGFTGFSGGLISSIIMRSRYRQALGSG